ncbi:MAG TPA: hypothetical protein DEP84_33855, partial [Chloroflexi bacterium]|nr:hypothetical protein [Chloroflexota bacterium]
MQIVRGVVTWWRLVAAAIVLLAGYTVSHYVAAAPVATPTPLTTVVVVEAAPRVVVVTATPSPIAESAGIKTPTAVPATPSGATRPTATKTERPATPSPTATPAPLAADQLAVVARIPLQPPLDNWDATSDHLVWLPDGGGLLAADGDGLHRLAGPNFTPLPPALAPLPANGRDLRLAADGRQLAFVAAGDVWAADVGAGALEGETRLLALPGRTDGATGSLHLVRWLPDGRLAATASCGRGCEELLALDRAGARPLLDFGERVSPTVPLGTDFLFSPSARLLAFQTRGEPHAVIADPEGDWWFLGGWREPERLRAYDQPVAWLDETMLLSYRRSPAGPSVNGHGLNLWRWDVLANTGRFMVADVAAVSPSPDGQQLALVLLGGPSVDEGGHLVGGRWRPDEPLPAV